MRTIGLYGFLIALGVVLDQWIKWLPWFHAIEACQQ